MATAKDKPVGVLRLRVSSTRHWVGTPRAKLEHTHDVAAQVSCQHADAYDFNYSMRRYEFLYVHTDD